ncbi:hypothetical protein ACQBAT_00615 [Ornithinimicrobium sp. Y1847]|uniref:hypothetical protein n=1 Tax=Ornithinimicrobium sp. Y1847 TaxID=3405419 RepID=UPI003B66CE6F
MISELERVLGLGEGELLQFTDLVAASGVTDADDDVSNATVKEWVRQVRTDWDMPRDDAFTVDLNLLRVTVHDPQTRSYSIEQVVRCELTGARRVPLLLRRPGGSDGGPLPDLRAVSGCTVGRVSRDLLAGLPIGAVELLMPRPLEVGESWRFEVETKWVYSCSDAFQIMTSSPRVRLSILQVIFDWDPAIISVGRGRMVHVEFVETSGETTSPLGSRSATVDIQGTEYNAAKILWGG